MCKFGDKSTNGQEKTISLGTSKGSVLELDHGKKLQKNYSVQKRNLYGIAFIITISQKLGAQVYLKQGREVLKLSLLRAG